MANTQQSDAILEMQYHDIMALYDLADELVDTVEDKSIKNPEAQLALVEPLIEAVGESADILTDMFIKIAGNPKGKKPSYKTKVEAALRRIYGAVDEYQAMVRKKNKSMKNIADAIVEKIKRQVETIISHFVDYINISLNSVMQFMHLQDLKKRQEKIASMLYHAQHGME